MNGILSNMTKEKKQLFLRLLMAALFSNIFFFLLFSGDSKPTIPHQLSLPENYVEMMVKAKSITPFQKGRKVIVLTQRHQVLCRGAIMLKQIEGHNFIQEEKQHYHLSVDPECIAKLLHQHLVVIAPYSEHQNLKKKTRRKYEIIY